MLNLSKKTLNLIKNHALQNSPNECCGLLMESGNYTHPYPCKNIAEDKMNNFTISPYDYLNADENGKIIGFYHSHCLREQPNEFTLLDKLNSINHKLPLILYYLPTDEFKIFNEKDLCSKYIGKHFEYGQQDCLSLVEDFYLNEFNIKLPKNNRNANWEKENPLRILENIKNYNFKTINNNKLKFGDVILINNEQNQYPVHLLIYIGNNQILHQKINSYSIVEQYNNLYKQKTHSILRHVDRTN